MRRFTLACVMAFAGCAGIVGIEDDFPVAPTASTDAGEDATVGPDVMSDSGLDTIVTSNELETVPSPCTKAPVAGAEDQVYEDVLPTSAEAPSVAALHEQGIISGCETSPSLFCPSCLLSRSALAKWLVLAKGVPLRDEPYPHFTDVPKNHPYYVYIETAFFEQWVDGFVDGTYRPQDPLSRGSTAVIVALAAELETPDPLPHTFTDVTAGSWWEESIEALSLACVTTGCSTTGPQFCPDKLITRRGAVVMVARAFGKVPKECTVDP